MALVILAAGPVVADSIEPAKEVVVTKPGEGAPAPTTDPRIEYYLAKKDWESLVKIGSPAVPRLLAALADFDQAVRDGACGALGQMSDRGTIEPLVTVMRNDRLLPVRTSAADALDKMGYTPANIDDQVALWFAGQHYDLANLGPQAGPPLRELLRKLKTEGDAWMIDERHFAATAVAKALGEIGDRAAVDVLIAAADGEDHVGSSYINVAPDYPLTCAAVTALGTMHDSKAVDHMITLIDEKEGVGNDVRLALAEALGASGDPRAAAPLARLLMRPYSRSQYDTDYRKATRDALVRFGTAAVEPSIAALKSEEPTSRVLAAEGLGQIGDKRAVPPLCALLHDQEIDVRAAAAAALGKIKDQQAVDPLVGALRDPSSKVRECAAEALDELGWKP